MLRARPSRTRRPGPLALYEISPAKLTNKLLHPLPALRLSEPSFSQLTAKRKSKDTQAREVVPAVMLEQSQNGHKFECVISTRPSTFSPIVKTRRTFLRRENHGCFSVR